MITQLRAGTVLLITLFAMTAARAETPAIPPFSTLTDLTRGGWEPLLFPKISRTTDYRLVTENGIRVVQARTHGGASGLIYRLQQPVTERLTLRWRWKVSNTYAQGDARRKEGDDYPARIYVAFEFRPEQAGLFERLKRSTVSALFGETLPGNALNYIWANHLPRGSMIANAYTGNTVMIAVESGPEASGQWREYERNLTQDYRDAFAEEPPPVVGIAIMTDGDNTGGQATAWYGDISLLP